MFYGDLLAPVEAEVVAPEHGKILSVQPDPWLRSGKLVVLEAYTRTEAHFVRFYNLTNVQVAEDEYVGAGQVIGRIGAVRRITRAHFNRARNAPFIELPDEIGLLRVTVSAGPSNTDGLLWPRRDPIPYFRSKVSGRNLCRPVPRRPLSGKRRICLRSLL